MSEINSELLRACSDGTSSKVTNLLKRGADINSKDENGNTPLHLAVNKGHETIVQQLIKAGANLNSANMRGVTPLYMATDRDNVYIMRLLLIAGADTNYITNEGMSALYLATMKWNRDGVEFLISGGADLNYKAENGNTALHYASNHGNLWIVNSLLHARATVDIENNFGETPLHMATMGGDSYIVIKLLESGANVNYQNKEGFTPLQLACSTGNTKKYINIVNILLKAKAVVNHQNKFNETALHMASEKGNIEIVTALLKAGAKVSIQNTGGNTSLHMASTAGHTAVVQKLLNARANSNHQNKYGFTALHMAVLNGHPETALVLLEKGANPYIRNGNGNSAVTAILSACWIDILAVLFTKPMDTAQKEEFLQAARSGDYCSDVNDFIFNKLGQTKVWKGWSRSDVEKLDTIFDEANAVNYSCCPVCMKFIERSEACMYMTHNCKDAGGYYHKDLYNKYKNSSGIITWCTICNRICVGHAHYSVSPAAGPVPDALFTASNPFETDCRLTSGGGGLPEKVSRFRRLREYALECQEDVGKRPEKEVLNELVEEMWNAPLRRERVVGKIMTNKKWNIPSNRFPANTVSNKAPESNAPNVKRPGTNSETLKPIVEPPGTNYEDEDGDLIHFRHRNPDGTVNEHEGVWITQQTLQRYLDYQVKNFGNERFGYCYGYPDCKSLLYPEEIKEFVSEELYEDYRKKFNKKFQAITGGARKRRGVKSTKKASKKLRNRKTRRGQRGGDSNALSIFVEATNAVCSVPPKRIGL